MNLLELYCEILIYNIYKIYNLFLLFAIFIFEISSIALLLAKEIGKREFFLKC
jgi:hypothetical protein